MAELLLINPKARTRKAPRKASPAQRRARAAFAAASRARSAAARASNPVRRIRRRRRNPVAAPASAAPVRRARSIARMDNPRRRRRYSRRRRNPIAFSGGMRSYINLIKDGLIGGAGAIGVDIAMGYISPYLPASLQRTPGTVGIGDGVKAIITVALGQLLARPTKGLSIKAAQGSLAVQAHAVLATFLPSTMTLGYAVPAPVANMSNRIGPNRRSLSVAGAGGMGRFTQPNAPGVMLSGFTQPGVSPMLGRSAAMARESVVR
jgi:hypothetical protein